MLRRPALRCAVLLTALVFLLPLATMADACTDCLWGAPQDCCPPACCSCCAHSPSVLTASVGMAPHPASIEEAQRPQEAPHPSFDPHDIFHVPKLSLA